MISASEDEASMMVRAWRHISWDAPDNFGIIGSDSIMGLWQSLTGNLFMVAVGLTAVFLVVGGIVIMNIMLASVIFRIPIPATHRNTAANPDQKSPRLDPSPT